MATISENLQTIKNSIDAIKQAIIDKGGTIEGDITTWANSISELSGGGNENLKIVNFGLFGSRIYVDGMTWSDWIDSIYNTRDSSCGLFYKYGDSDQVYCSYGYISSDGATPVLASQLISDSILYTITHSGE